MSGFWDGGQTWKLRVAPLAAGIWTYATTSNDPLLNGLTGSFTADAATSGGFVVSDGYGFLHWSDGEGQSHNLVAPDTNCTCTATFDTTGHFVLADFTAMPTSGTAPLTAQFTDQSVGEVDTWAWNFGDGTEIVTTRNPAHTFTYPGSYSVQLVVGSIQGSDTWTRTDSIHALADSVTFCDNFFDGDISDWYIEQETWSVINGDLDGSQVHGEALILSPLQTIYEGHLSVDCYAMPLASFEAARIIIFFQDDYHYRCLEMREGEDLWKLVKVIDGIQYAHVIWDQAIQSGKFYHVDVYLFENGSVSVFVDHQNLFNDPFLQHQSGKIGLAVVAGITRFDDFCFQGALTSTPLADFRAAPVSGYEPLTVHFSDHSTGIINIC